MAHVSKKAPTPYSSDIKSYLSFDGLVIKKKIKKPFTIRSLTSSVLTTKKKKKNTQLKRTRFHTMAHTRARARVREQSFDNTVRVHGVNVERGHRGHGTLVPSGRSMSRLCRAGAARESRKMANATRAR